MTRAPSIGWAEPEHAASASPPYWVLYSLKEAGVSRPDKALQFSGCNSELVRVTTASAKPPEFSRVVFPSGHCRAANKQQLPAEVSSLPIINTSVKLPEHLPLVIGCKSHSTAFSLVKVWCWLNTVSKSCPFSGRCMETARRSDRALKGIRDILSVLEGAALPSVGLQRSQNLFMTITGRLESEGVAFSGELWVHPTSDWSSSAVLCHTCPFSTLNSDLNWGNNLCTISSLQTYLEIITQSPLSCYFDNGADNLWSLSPAVLGTLLRIPTKAL